MMFAHFLTSRHLIDTVVEYLEVQVEIQEHCSGRLTVVLGSPHSVMRVIGSLADHGEDCLYKAGPV